MTTNHTQNQPSPTNSPTSNPTKSLTSQDQKEKNENLNKEQEEIIKKQSTLTEGEQPSSKTVSPQAKIERQSSSQSIEIVDVKPSKEKKKKRNKIKKEKESRKKNNKKKSSDDNRKDETAEREKERKRRKHSKKRRPLDLPPATPPWIHEKMAYRANLRAAHPPQRYPEQVLIEKSHIQESVLDSSMQKILNELVETIKKEPPAQAPRQYRRGSDISDIRISHNSRINSPQIVDFSKLEEKKEQNSSQNKIITFDHSTKSQANLAKQGWESLKKTVTSTKYLLPNPAVTASTKQVINLDNSSDSDTLSETEAKSTVLKSIQQKQRAISFPQEHLNHHLDHNPSYFGSNDFQKIQTGQKDEIARQRMQQYQNPHLVRKWRGLDGEEKTKKLVVDLQVEETQRNMEIRKKRYQQRQRRQGQANNSEEELSPNGNDALQDQDLPSVLREE